ncbi:MAG: fused MFS/spermidine synthase, partial [Thermodesulfobacteriota bacterium]
MAGKKKATKRKPAPRPDRTPARTAPRSPLVYPAVLVCFFLSGSAGLVYQVLWVRLFERVIGSAPFAVASVLTVFMAGLALGSWAAGRRADRAADSGRLLAWYGKLELGVGLYGLALPFLIQPLEPLYAGLYDRLFQFFWLYNFITFLLCFLLLVLPVALMGATLPILCRFYVEQLDHLGRRTGRLYGINTVGAAAGVLLAGFLLVNRLGVYGTV